MILGGIVVFAKDLEESIKFYTEVLGLEVTKRIKINENREIAFIEESAVKIELIHDKTRSIADANTVVNMIFLVEDIESEYEKLKASSINVITGLLNPAPGVEFFHIADPNGVVLVISKKH